MTNYKTFKTTHGTYFRGVCRSPSNCYYKGTSVVWVVAADDIHDGFNEIDEGAVMGFKTKKAANKFAEWANFNGVADDGCPIDNYYAATGDFYVVEQSYS